MVLRPLIVITGSVCVEGGDARTTRRTRTGRIEQRTISADRRAANVVSTGYARRLRQLCLLRSPFGALIEVERLPAVKELVASAEADVERFNTEHQDARLINTLVWERLNGNRLAVVEAWVARTQPVLAPQLRAPSSAA